MTALLDLRDDAAQAYFTTAAAAEYLGRSVNVLAIMRHRGEGPAYSKIGRTVVYARADLDEWMQSHRAK